MRIEFLLAWEDTMWTTKVFEVPEEICVDDSARTDRLIAWASENLGRQAQYRKVVLFAVYSTVPEEPDRCEHGMFYSGAGACPQCGGGAE